MLPNLLPLSFNIASLKGISEKTLSIHHDKLYIGYVAKKEEIQNKLNGLRTTDMLPQANQTYSELRSLKDGEVFATNGVYLHEWYFANLGGDGAPSGTLVDELTKLYQTWKNFVSFFSACGMAARGWVVLAWSLHDQALRIYTCDTHHQGGVWGCFPLLVLDIYEHAYFIDYGADRKSYIDDWWKNLDWKKINKNYEKIKTLTFNI